jgi:hypothetical protein
MVESNAHFQFLVLEFRMSSPTPLVAVLDRMTKLQLTQLSRVKLQAAPIVDTATQLVRQTSALNVAQPSESKIHFLLIDGLVDTLALIKKVVSVQNNERNLPGISGMQEGPTVYWLALLV